MQPKVTYSINFHNKESRIFIYFDFNQDLINRVKKLEGVQYSKTYHAWHIADTDENRLKFKLPDKISTSRELVISKSKSEKHSKCQAR